MTRKTEDTLLHDLHHTYLLMKMSGVEFTYENLAQYSDADTTGQVPHPNTVEMQFGSLSRAFKKLNVDVPPSLQTKYTEKELKHHFYRVYQELKDRGISFNRVAYLKLAEEDKYSDLPSYKIYLNKYGSLEGILKEYSLYISFKEHERENLSSLLSLALSETTKRGLFFNVNTYITLKKEERFKHLPSYKTLWSTYGKWENILKEADLHERVVKEDRALLMMHLSCAYKEITKRQMPFNLDSYLRLRKESKFRYLPTLATYEKRFINWEDAVKACGLKENFNGKFRSSESREKLFTIDNNGKQEKGKKCRVCTTIKLLDEMAPSSNQPSGKDSICIDCKAERARAYYAKYKNVDRKTTKRDA